MKKKYRKFREEHGSIGQEIQRGLRKNKTGSTWEYRTGSLKGTMEV